MKGKEERKKKGYLIAKALHQFMWASILASVASQIAMTTDAIVVSQFIGTEAISAINLTPLLLLPSIFPSIRVCFNDSVLCIIIAQCIQIAKHYVVHVKLTMFYIYLISIKERREGKRENCLKLLGNFRSSKKISPSSDC